MKIKEKAGEYTLKYYSNLALRNVDLTNRDHYYLKSTRLKTLSLILIYET